MEKFELPCEAGLSLTTHTGNGRVLCWSRGPSLGASVVSITNSPATLFYAASTLKVDTGKSLFTHTVSDSKLRVPHPQPVAFWDSALPEHRWAFLHVLVI